MSEIDLKNLNVVFAGCARDCEKYIPKVFENLKSYSSLFKDSYKIIVENGSKDKTREILKNLKNNKDYFYFKDEFNDFNFRGKRLEFARNLIIEKIKDNHLLNSCDLLIILDFDDNGSYRIDENNLKRAINFLFSKENIGAVFANQDGTYYDMWGLIDEKYCNNDFWVDALKYIIKKINPGDRVSTELLEDMKINLLDKKKIKFEQNLPPIKVKSAYGGFGIYKMNYVIKNKRRYEGFQKIDLIFKDGTKKKIDYQKNEIVNFNEGLIDLGVELYILPYLINNKYTVDRDFPPRAAFALIVDQNDRSII